MTRQFERLVSRKVGEFTAAKILGQRLPRKLRRLMGRVYGNAAYRELKVRADAGLYPDRRDVGVSSGGGYSNYRPHPSVVGYVAAETQRTIERLFNPPMPELPPLPETESGTENVSSTADQS